MKKTFAFVFVVGALVFGPLVSFAQAAETNGALKALARARPLQCRLEISNLVAATTPSLVVLMTAIKQDLSTKNILITKVEWPPSAEILFDAGARSLATLTNVQLLTADGRRFVLRTKGLGTDGVWAPLLITETGAQQLCSVSPVVGIEVPSGRLSEDSKRFETEVVEQSTGDVVASGVYERYRFTERPLSVREDPANAQRFCVIDWNCPF